MNREELLIEMQERMNRGESAYAILDWLDSIGYEAEVAPGDPGYVQASMRAVADSVATFYLSLRARSVPPEMAVQLTATFLTNSQRSVLTSES